MQLDFIDQLDNIVKFNISCEYKEEYGKRFKVTQGADAVEFLRKIWGNDIEYHEKFYALYLNRSNQVTGYALISIGSYAGTIVDIRKILQNALMTHASGIILAHNHPSGNTQESNQDRTMTRKVIDAAELLDIQVLDHIILTQDSFMSFANEGKLPR